MQGNIFLKKRNYLGHFMIEGISKNKTGNKERTKSTTYCKIGYLQSTHKLNRFLGLLHFAIMSNDLVLQIFSLLTLNADKHFDSNFQMSYSQNTLKNFNALKVIQCQKKYRKNELNLIHNLCHSSLTEKMFLILKFINTKL